MQFVISGKFTQSYQIELGKIVIAMADLDSALFTLLSSILDNVYFSTLLVAGNRLERVLEIISAAFYCKNRDESTVMVFKNIMQDIDNISTRRNDNIHGQWTFDENTKMAARWKIPRHKNGKLNGTKTGRVPISELEQLVYDAYKLRDDILLFRTINFRSSKENIPQEILERYKQQYDEQIKEIESKNKKLKKKTRKTS